MIETETLRARRRVIEPAKPTTTQRVARHAARAFEAAAILLAVFVVAWALVQ